MPKSRNKGDAIQFYVPKGKRDKIRAHAEKAGYQGITDYLIAYLEAETGLSLKKQMGRPKED